MESPHTGDKKVFGRSIGIDFTLLCLLVVTIACLLLMHDMMETSLIGQSSWDSYSLQADSWRQGRVDVDEEHASYLELAEYDGKYFVSFPPFPSVVMFPFTLVYGAKVPSNLIIAAMCIAIVVLCYKILQKLGMRDTHAAIFAFFFVFGSNIAFMSINSGVWFMAQVMNVLLCTLSVCFAIFNHRKSAYAMLALAVGCRPFSVLYFPLLFIFIFMQDKAKFPELSFWELCKRQLTCIVFPAIVALAYMLYNYVRFENLLEFGHNYLPEFTESEHGQFSLTYLFDNLARLHRLPKFYPNLNFDLPSFNGFLYFVANPIFLLVIIRGIKNLITRKLNIVRALILTLMMLNILLLCCHKTLGGWQFGARYTVDMIPFALLYLLITDKPPKSYIRLTLKAPAQLNHLEFTVIILGIMLNLYGTAIFWGVNQSIVSW